MKTIWSRNRIKDEKIAHYTVGQAFFTKSIQDWKMSLCFARVIGRSLSSGVVLRKTLNLCMKFQFIGNFKVTQYFVIIVGQHFQWLEFYVKIYGMAGNQCVFSAQEAGKSRFFLKLLAGISTCGHPE